MTNKIQHFKYGSPEYTAWEKKRQERQGLIIVIAFSLLAISVSLHLWFM